MGLIQKQSTKSGLFQILGVFLSLVQLLVVFPALLTREEIGIIRLFIDLSFITAPLFLFGSGAVYLKFYFEFKAYLSMLQKLRVWVVLMNFVGFAVFGILLFILRPQIEGYMFQRSPEFIPFFKLVPLMGLFVSVFQLSRVFSQVKYEIQVANILDFILVRLLLIGLAIGVYFMDLNYTQIVICVVLIYALISFIQCSLHLKIFAQELRSFPLSNVFDLPVKAMLSFGTFTFIVSLTDGFVVKLDTWMISSMIGIEQVGVYAIALQLGMLIEFPKRSINQIIVPLISKEWAKKNMGEIQNLYRKTSLVQLILGGVLFALIFLNIDGFYALIPNGELYQDGKWVVFFIGLGKWFAIATGANIEILQLSPYYRHSLWIRFVLLSSAVVTNFIFIPLFGIIGAAIATSITYFLNNSILSFLVWKKLRIHPFTSKSIQAFLVISFAFFVAFIPSFENVYVNVFVKSSLFLLITISLVYAFKISEDLQRLVRTCYNSFKG